MNEGRFALGLGCHRGAAADELIALAEALLAAHGVKPEDVAGLYSLDKRRAEPALAALAEKLRRPLRVFDSATLERETPRLATPSDAVFAATGCHGVAEAAALAAAGAAARLIAPKRKGTGVTAALAEAPQAFDGAARGMAP